MFKTENDIMKNIQRKFTFYMYCYFYFNFIFFISVTAYTLSIHRQQLT